MRVFLLKATLLVALALGGSGCGDDGYSESAARHSAASVAPVATAGVGLGALAPNFKLWDLRGRPVSLSDYRGKVVLVNFWATWCGPCKVEMPAMERLYREFSGQGFEILAVSTDAQGVAVTRPFKESMGLTFPILHDSDYRVGFRYGARTLPMSFVVDGRGVVRHRIFGARDWHSPEARRLVQSLVSDL